MFLILGILDLIATGFALFSAIQSGFFASDFILFIACLFSTLIFFKLDSMDQRISDLEKNSLDFKKMQTEIDNLKPSTTEPDNEETEN